MDTTKKTFHIKDPGSSITHFIGMVLSILAAPPLLIKGYHDGGLFTMGALAVFIVSMILLYAASTIYHTFDISPAVNRVLRKIDHMMIFILIAGTYTPICVISLGDRTGLALLVLIWTIAIVGIIIKACWITCPKWFSSVLYISMGWVGLLALPKVLQALPKPAFGWLLAGGVIYTLGGIIYALKLSFFNFHHPYFGSHEIFHLFVMGGSFCHYVMIYQYIA